MINQLPGYLTKEEQLNILNGDANALTELLYFNKLMSMVLVEFEWLNIPESMDTRFMEICNAYYGAFVGFRSDENGALLSLQVMNSGELNIYWNPVRYRAFSLQFQQECTIDDSVICYNNEERTPSIFIVKEFARRLADIQRTKDVRLIHHKAPMIFKGSKKTLASIRAVFKKVVENKTHFVIDPSATGIEEGLTSQLTETQFINDKLEQEKKAVWNEAMLFLGIDNAKQDKNERMIVSEVESNNEQIALARASRLKARKDFCAKFNAMFGTNIDVRYRRDSEKEEESKEGDNVD